MSFQSPVAITGIGALCAVGSNLNECMESLYAGRRKVAAPGAFSSSHGTAWPVCEMAALLPGEQEQDAEPDLLRTSRLGLAAAREALSDAGLQAADLSRLRVGVIMGTTVGSAMNNEAFYRQYRQGEHPEMAPIERYLRSNPAAAIARAFALSGPCQTVVNACSSGTDAIGLGASWIRAGLCDLVLAGGADELCRVTYNGFSSLMITDAGPCRPFDVRRRGLNLGEGAAVLVLESESLHRDWSRNERGWVLGYGSACDAYHLTAPRPDGLGLKKAIAEALSGSGRKVEDLAFVNAHGTGTPDNDRVESRVLSELMPGVPFLSTKGFTGHTLGAAGALEAAFTLACLEQARIPASIGFGCADPELPAAPVTEVTEIEGGCALSESLAFGGNNAVLILGAKRGIGCV